MKIEEAKYKSELFLKNIQDLSKRKIAEIRRNEMLKNYAGDDEAVSFRETMEKVKNSPIKEVWATGHTSLDDHLDGGFKAGELVLLSGYTNNGKTSFAFDLTRRMGSHNFYWLPFEESAEELAEKCLKYGTAPLDFYHPKIIVKENIEWIEERIMEASIKYNSKIIVIDNLHFITMSESNSFTRTGMFAKHLKQIAGRLGVCIILIAHLRKSGDGMDKMPTIEDISGDSDAVKIANKTISVWQEQVKELGSKKVKYTGTTFVIVQKVRSAYGKKGAIPFNWSKGEYTEMTLEELSRKLSETKDNKIKNDF